MQKSLRMGWIQKDQKPRRHCTGDQSKCRVDVGHATKCRIGRSNVVEVRLANGKNRVAQEAGPSQQSFAMAWTHRINNQTRWEVTIHGPFINEHASPTNLNCNDYHWIQTSNELNNNDNRRQRWQRTQAITAVEVYNCLCHTHRHTIASSCPCCTGMDTLASVVNAVSLASVSFPVFTQCADTFTSVVNLHSPLLLIFICECCRFAFMSVASVVDFVDLHSPLFLICVCECCRFAFASVVSVVDLHSPLLLICVCKCCQFVFASVVDLSLHLLLICVFFCYWFVFMLVVACVFKLASVRLPSSEDDRLHNCFFECALMSVEWSSSQFVR